MRHREQPGVKRTTGWIIVEGSQADADRPQHLLSYIRRVSILKPMPPGIPINERSIKAYELPPCFAVLRIPQANEQTGPRIRRFSHTGVLDRYFWTWRKTFQMNFDEVLPKHQ